MRIVSSVVVSHAPTRRLFAYLKPKALWLDPGVPATVEGDPVLAVSPRKKALRVAAEKDVATGTLQIVQQTIVVDPGCSVSVLTEDEYQQLVSSSSQPQAVAEPADSKVDGTEKEVKDDTEVQAAMQPDFKSDPDLVEPDPGSESVGTDECVRTTEENAAVPVVEESEAPVAATTMPQQSFSDVWPNRRDVLTTAQMMPGRRRSLRV